MSKKAFIVGAVSVAVADFAAVRIELPAGLDGPWVKRAVFGALGAVVAEHVANAGKTSITASALTGILANIGADFGGPVLAKAGVPVLFGTAGVSLPRALAGGATLAVANMAGLAKADGEVKVPV